ncbi:MAG TPA: hypothetical protein VGG54_22810 [Trebonia sp.]|jgi:hypothetical protein
MTPTIQERLKAARSAADAVRIAAAHCGVALRSGSDAELIAEAACGFADGVVELRQTVPRYYWQDADGIERLRQRMRHQLLDLVTSEGRVPVSLPTETITHQQSRPGGEGTEVGMSGDWDEAVVVLSVGVRTPPYDRAAAAPTA